MANLKAYRWEHATFPDEQKVNISYPERKFLPTIIAKRFGISNMGVHFDLRRANSGKACPSQYGGYIRLPKFSLTCSLGVIYHEIAHVLNDKIYKDNKRYHHGHLGSFKTALIKVYAEAHQFIMTARSEAVAMAEQWHQERQAQDNKRAKELERKAQLKVMRKTPEYKIEQLKKRIKNLETRSKRINTILKSAKRKLSISERYLAKRKAQEQCVTTNNEPINN